MLMTKSREAIWC